MRDFETWTSLSGSFNKSADCSCAVDCFFSFMIYTTDTTTDYVAIVGGLLWKVKEETRKNGIAGM